MLPAFIKSLYDFSLRSMEECYWLLVMVHSPSLTQPGPTYEVKPLKQDMTWSRTGWSCVLLMGYHIQQITDLVKVCVTTECCHSLDQQGTTRIGGRVFN